MTKQEAIDLMKTSTNNDEWDANCDKVKDAFLGYPDWWYKEIILSGLMRSTLGNGSDQPELTTITIPSKMNQL